jgi:hypothetical protein
VILALVLGNCAGVAGMRGLEAGGSILNVDFSTGNTPPISPYPPSLQYLSVSHIEWEGLEKGLEAGGSILNVDCSTGNTPPILLYPPWLVSIAPIKPKLLPDWRLLAGIAKQLMLFSLCGVPWGVEFFLGPYLWRLKSANFFLASKVTGWGHSMVLWPLWLQLKHVGPCF